MEKSRSLWSPTGLLLCNENVACLEDKGKGMEEFAAVLGEGYDEEYIQTLLEGESTCDGLQLQDYLKDSWIERARLDGIQYILRRSEHFGFTVQTAYASVVYLDKFLSRRSIDGEKSWAMRLLSMSCLSLAAKMEEISVPLLSDFCVNDYNFNSQMIQKMELMVLNELGWKLGLITPFSFIEFLADKLFDKFSPRDGVSKVEEAILATVGDVRIMCHKASVMAAAATLFVLDQRFSRESLQLKIGALASSLSFDLESIVSCYRQLQEIKIERSNMSKGIESPYLSPLLLHNSEPYESSSIASSAKRKRLVFSQNDLFDNVPDKKVKPRN